MKSITLVSALAAAGSASAALTAVTVGGNAFWAGKERFYLRGIDYQPGGAAANTDPLADSKVCKRDIEKFQELKINVVRVYAVDNSADHDECMKALDDAGIYLVLDVNNPKFSINRKEPEPSYNAKYLQSVFATVEMFSKYDNTLAFFSGNEVMNDEEDTDKSAPYVKAVTRDMKNYMNARGLRKVPVGYSAADVASNRMQTAQYMNCGSDDARSDFFAFNDYSWCNSDFKTAGWDQKVKNFTDYGLPIFLSEWGCIKNRPRKFDEVEAMMSSEMTGVYSGGLMYEYSIEDNEFGIVKLSGDSVDPIDEFDLFKDALSKNPAPTGDGGAAKSTHSVDCPSEDANVWQVNPTAIPAMPSQAEKYMKDGAGKGPGLDKDGAGSQQATDSGTSTSSVTSGEASPSATGSGSNKKDNGNGAAASNPIASLAITGAAMAIALMGTLAL